MKKSLKLILASLLIVVIFTGLSVVSASDVNISDTNSSISTGNTNLQTSNLLIEEDNSNYQQNVGNSSEYSNEYSSANNDVAVTSDGNTTRNTGSYTDLANLINNSNGTINLKMNYTYNPDFDTNYTYGINITHYNLVINGNGYTINANNQSGIFNIYNSTVTLNDLNLINEKTTNAYYNGGAIYGLNSTIFVNNCNLTNNHESNIGGAIYTYICNLTVTNSTFTNNSAPFNGGAIAAEDSNVTVRDCEFYNNIVNTTEIINLTEYYGGGAIAIDKGRLLVSNSIFEGNIATGNEKNIYAGEGGAIFLYNTTGFINDSWFDSNSASAAAGAIWSWYGTLGINDTGFVNNVAKRNGGAVLVDGNLYVNNSLFEDNSVNSTNPLTGFIYGGGALYQYNGEFYITNSMFIGNIATGSLNDSGMGGAIHSNGTVYVSNSNFFNNTALIGGGAISTSNANINDSTFFNNFALIGGGAINLKNGNITQSIFFNNTAKEWGGAINTEGIGNVNLSYSILLNNKLVNNSGIEGGIVIDYLGNFTSNYNWWGNNTPFNGTDNNRLICHYINTTDKVFESPDNCVIMTLNVNATNVTLGDILDFTVSFTHYTDGNNTYNMTSLIPELPVSITCNDEYNSSLKVLAFNNTYIFEYVTKTSGNFTANVTSLYQTLTYNFTVYPLIDKDTFIDLTETYFVYGNNTFSGVLMDINGNQVANRNVSLNLTRASTGAWKVYNVTTDIFGYFTLPITLAPGLYVVSGVFNGDKDYNPSNITTTTLTIVKDVNSTILTANTFQEKYKAGKNFTGFLLDSQGEPIVNQTIAVKLTRLSNGLNKVYYVTTDSNGQYQLPINLGIGSYMAECSYNGTSQYESIVQVQV